MRWILILSLTGNITLLFYLLSNRELASFSSLLGGALLWWEMK
jgi:hypothetical protein